jgi:hypothetical protein
MNEEVELLRSRANCLKGCGMYNAQRNETARDVGGLLGP